MNAMHFTQGHEQQMMIPEPDHFREGFAIVARRLNAANFAERREGSFRFHHEADELDDAAALFRDARLTHPAGSVLQAAGSTWIR
jgi:hypothetical protein